MLTLIPCYLLLVRVASGLANWDRGSSSQERGLHLHVGIVLRAYSVKFEEESCLYQFLNWCFDRRARLSAGGEACASR